MDSYSTQEKFKRNQQLDAILVAAKNGNWDIGKSPVRPMKFTFNGVHYNGSYQTAVISNHRIRCFFRIVLNFWTNDYYLGYIDNNLNDEIVAYPEAALQFIQANKVK